VPSRGKQGKVAPNNDLEMHLLDRTPSGQIAVAMKKILIRGLIVVAILLIVAVVAIGMSLNSAIKKGIETFGPQVTGVAVTVDSVDLSIFNGKSTIKQLVVGNPEGYKTPEAMSLGLASVAVAPGSIFSDKVVVKSIRIEAPQVTFEFGPGGSNLQRIQKNLEAFSGGGSTNTAQPAQTETKPGKKLQVDEIIVMGGKVTIGASALGGSVLEAPLPEIELKSLGQGPEGITGAELGHVILAKINEEALKAYGDKLAEAGAKALQNLSNNATNTVNEAASNALNKLNKFLIPKQK